MAHADEPRRLQVEIGLGAVSFDQGDDGLWVQSAHPHSTDLTSLSASIGARGDIRSGFGWRAGYMYFGNASFSSLATERDEDAHRQDVPLQSLRGHGNVQGLYAGITWAHHWVTLECGVFAYKPTWSVHAISPDGSQQADLHYGGGIHTSFYLGIGAGPVHLLYYPNVKASGEDGPTATPALYDGAAWQLMVRLCFPKPIVC